MLQLAYSSTARPDWDGDLQTLCEESARNNEQDEITGILLYRNGAFLQVLEGPKATVEDTFLRIVTDPRHDSLTILSRRMLTRREFGDWAMATIVPDAEQVATIEKVRTLMVDRPASVRADFELHFGEPCRSAETKRSRAQR